ncbi:MAG: hypothetical protein K6A36_06845 [Paludibacteraceae bacterium]|nr:hypothetical protein [Paludibacteraceae bacterium]
MYSPAKKASHRAHRSRVITKKHVRHFDRRGRLIGHEEYLNGSLVSGYVCNYNEGSAYPVLWCNKRLGEKRRNRLDTIGCVIRTEHYSTGELKSIDSIVCIRFLRAQNVKRNLPNDKYLSKQNKPIENNLYPLEKLVAIYKSAARQFDMPVVDRNEIPTYTAHRRLSCSNEPNDDLSEESEEWMCYPLSPEAWSTPYNS